MTSFSVERFAFDQTKISEWGQADPRHRNWPVVYLMNNNSHVYVGESINAENRMRQHLESAEKRDLAWVRVVLDERFNKSACLDLESFLIRMFSGDGEYQVLNHNAGITDAEYYDRALYQRTFDEVFEQLRANEQLFTRSIPEIVNSDLFKLSPFKALNHDQAAVPKEANSNPTFRIKSLEYGEGDMRDIHHSTMYIVSRSYMPRFWRRAWFCRSRCARPAALSRGAIHRALATSSAARIGPNVPSATA